MKRIALVLAALSLLVSGCGGKDNDEEGKDALEGAACAANTVSGTSGGSLPQGFPQEDGVTLTGTTTAGPTTITTGTTSKGLGDVYAAYKRDLAKDPYHVTKAEKDEHDAEVNFASN